MFRRVFEKLPDIRYLIILFGVVLLLAVWIGLYFKVTHERELQRAAVVRDTANYARTFDENTTRTIRGMDQIAQFLKYLAERDGLNVDIASLVRKGAFTGQPFVQLGIANELGNSVTSSVQPFFSVNIQDLEHFYVHREADMRRLFVSKPIVGRTSGKWSIQLTRRINKPDGSFGGVVVVSIDPHYFADLYNRINLGESSSIFLIGRDGIARVLQTDKKLSFGLDFRGNTISEQLTTGANIGSFTLDSPIDGVRRIYSFRTLQEYPLAIVVGISEKEAFRALNQRIGIYLWFCGVITVVIIGFVIMLLLRILRQRRAEAALRDLNGQLEQKVEERTQDLTAANEEITAQNEEITAMNEELTAQNEEMRALNEEIAGLYQNLSEINATLERKVEERTSDLIAAHPELSVQFETLQQAQNNLKIHADIQTVLREIAEAALRDITLDAFYERVYHAVRRVLPSQNFYFVLIDENSHEIVVPFIVSDQQQIPRRRPMGKGISEYALKQGKALHLSESALKELRESGEVSLRFAEVKQWVSAPLCSKSGRTFGLIVLSSTKSDIEYAPEYVETLAIVAAQVSLAIERKQMEEALRDTGDHLQKLIQYANAPIIVWNPDLTISRFNRAFEGLSGYRAEEVIGKPLSMLFPAERLDETMALIEESRSGLHWEAEEIVILRKNGETRVTLWNSANIYAADGETLTAVIAQGQDVTERVRREQELRRDVELANRIQQAMLNVTIPSPYVSVSTIYQPFGYVGGDLYYLDWRYDDSLLRGFLIDVTGHGLATSLHTAAVHVLLREVNEMDLPLTEAVHWLNIKVGSYFDEGTFAGAIGFEVDLETRQLRWVCAGIPLVFMDTGAYSGRMACPGMCIGIHEEERYELHTQPINVGDVFYFMTDGLAEVLDATLEMPIQAYPGSLQQLQELVRSNRCRDDATALCVYIKDLPQSQIRRDGWPKTLRLNGYGDYQRFKGEVARILEEVTGLPHSVHEVAVHEALANAMECRDGVPRQHRAVLTFNRIGRRLIVRVKTSRIGFAGNALLRRLRSNPDMMFAFGEEASMGRGIPLMLSLSDRMTYNSEGTEVLLAWKLKR